MTKSLSIYVAICALAVLTSCSRDRSNLIVGKWAVQSVHYVIDDHTAGTHDDYTRLATDTSYVGYDTIDFNDNGTTRWHMNDRYFHNGLFAENHRDFSYLVSDDSLFVYVGTMDSIWQAYAITQLDRKALAFESYRNTPAEYSHHHIKQTESYTLRRVN